MDKFCKDCKHYQYPNYCTRAGSYTTNLVTGQQDYDSNNYSAAYQRWWLIGFDILWNKCGTRGRFWEKQ